MDNSAPSEKLPAVLRPDVRVRLIGDGPFFGPGTARLLDRIEREGSVLRACEELGLSYSKGRRMLREVERQLGQPAVRCTKGGPHGGSACLTEVGRQLLENYQSYERQVRQYAEEQFSSCFSLPEDAP